MDSPLFLDTSFSQIEDIEWRQLFALANEKSFSQKRADLFQGKKINYSENRSVLHTALRNLKKIPVYVDDHDVMPAIEKVWQHMAQCCTEFEAVTDVIHIGIGGSDFGPRLVCEAFKNLPTTPHQFVRVHFLSNVDSADCEAILKTIPARSVRVIIVSKTFTTVETLKNAQAVITWLKSHTELTLPIADHLYAVTAHAHQAQHFGILEKNIFPFWDWVGGRFSVWSAVGLPIALQCGFATFQSFLSGAEAMDQHFLKCPAQKNQPLLLALALFHQQKTLGVKSQAIIPYAQALHLFPHWLQQLEMESNGKTAGLDGQLVQFSAPVIFGIPGTNAQHSFFQMLHQGPEVIPVDFIAVDQSMGTTAHHQEQHRMLWAHCLAQSQAFATGQGDRNDLNHFYPGKRPNNLIVLPRLDAFHLGALMALYEHRTFCLGMLYGINSFDQPGVELGKQLAIPIEAALNSTENDTKDLHPVTAQRIRRFKHSTLK